MLGVWVLGGLIVLCGALAFAELSASMPETGGMYVYLREGWGRPYGFLYGWAQLVLIRAAALGGISSVFGEYFLRVIGIDPAQHPALGRLSRRRRDHLRRRHQHRRRPAGRAVRGPLDDRQVRRAGAARRSRRSCMGGNVGALVQQPRIDRRAPIDAGVFGLALISVMWAYDGFADLTFASGEVKDPQRNLPRAIIIGTLLIIAIYLLGQRRLSLHQPDRRAWRSRG